MKFLNFMNSYFISSLFISLNLSTSNVDVVLDTQYVYVYVGKREWGREDTD